MYFSSNSSLSKYLSSVISNFSCFLTSVFSLPLNSVTTSFVFSKSSFLSQLSYSTVNSFYLTKYFTTLLTFCLFNIFSTSHSLTPFTSIGFTFSTFCSSTCSLYLTIQLTFTTGWILIELDSHNFTALVDITSSMKYRPTYWSTSFLAGLFLNARSFIFNITLSFIFHFSTSFLFLYACCFISFCTFLNATTAFSCTFFILSANYIAFSTFSFFLISASIFNSLS